MLYRYQAKTQEGESRSGTIEAPSLELAVRALQRGSLVIVGLEPIESEAKWYEKLFSATRRVGPLDTLILSRQLAILFEAKVPLVVSLKVLGEENPNLLLRKTLTEVLSDIQSGLSLSQALSRHPEVFSSFYVNMVRAGEESGKLEEVFSYLAEYLEHSYQLQSKARNALIYPAILFVALFTVLYLMLVVVIPRLSSVLTASGAEIPVYTRFVIGLSNFLRKFGFFLLLILAASGVALWRYVQTFGGRLAFHRFLLSLPLIGNIMRKFYLARLAEAIETLLSGGVTAVRTLELAADVIGNELYALIIRESTLQVKSGVRLSEAFSRYEEIPALMTQMIKIGEETGKLNFILKALARFYRREVDNLLDNLVGLIEPVMIIVLGLGVGFMVGAVLLPIYNIATTI